MKRNSDLEIIVLKLSYASKRPFFSSSSSYFIFFSNKFCFVQSFFFQSKCSKAEIHT